MSFCAAVAGRYFKETIPEIFTHFSTFYAILVSYDITLGCSNRMKRFIGLLMALTIAGGDVCRLRGGTARHPFRNLCCDGCCFRPGASGTRRS